MQLKDGPLPQPPSGKGCSTSLTLPWTAQVEPDYEKRLWEISSHRNKLMIEDKFTESYMLMVEIIVGDPILVPSVDNEGHFQLFLWEQTRLRSQCESKHVVNGFVYPITIISPLAGIKIGNVTTHKETASWMGRAQYLSISVKVKSLCIT